MSVWCKVRRVFRVFSPPPASPPIIFKENGSRLVLKVEFTCLPSILKGREMACWSNFVPQAWQHCLNRGEMFIWAGNSALLCACLHYFLFKSPLSKLLLLLLFWTPLKRGWVSGCNSFLIPDDSSWGNQKYFGVHVAFLTCLHLFPTHFSPFWC